MPQLPCTRRNQDQNLANTVPYCPTIGQLAQIPEIGFTLSLVLLFSPYILEFLVQVTKLGGEFAHVRAIVFTVRFGGANNNVEV